MSSDDIQKRISTLTDSQLRFEFHSHPNEVKKELIYRLKKSNLNESKKRVEFNLIINRWRFIVSLTDSLSSSKNVAEVSNENLDISFFQSTYIENLPESFRTSRSFKTSEDWEEEFEGKSKPSDWKPEKSENCFICNGTGKGKDSRICSKCMGRGYISFNTN